MRDRVTLDELLSFIDKVPNAGARLVNYWDNAEPGDTFIIQGESQIRTLLYDNADEPLGVPALGYWVYYEENGEKLHVKHSDCIPLFNIRQMMEAITVFEDLQIQSARKKWIVITNGKIFTGKKEEDLCSVLWKATMDYVQMIY